MTRPTPQEYGEYFSLYVNLVEGDDILAALTAHKDSFVQSLTGVSDKVANTIHKPYSWSIKQVIGHLIDGEKIFGYRLHCFACGDQTELPGFDHEPYVNSLDYRAVELADLASEFSDLRNSNIRFLKRLPKPNWNFSGTASECNFTVRSLAYVLAGHVAHHAEIIKNRIGQ